MEPTDNNTYKIWRVNVLAAAAYVTILVCLAVTVWFTDISEYAQGIITLVLGRFLGYTDAVYNFEFGTTRANKVKDETISNLTASAAQQSATQPAAPQKGNTP